MLEPNDEIAAAARRIELELELPRLERLLDVVDALEHPLGLADLHAQCAGPAPTRAAPMSPCLATARAQEALDVEAPLLRVVVATVLALACARARSLVLAPAARPLADALTTLLELDDPVDGSVEELAVVRDDHDTPAEVLDEPLQPREPIEVEVVRRLVEAVNVVAGEQKRRQPGSCGLPARGCVERPLRIEPELRRDG